MALVSITEAADLTGKSISILYQYIQEGKLSTNNDKINTTELIQLIGVHRSLTDYRRENEFLHNLTTHLKNDKERLYQINDLLRKSNADLKQEKDKLYRIIILSKQKLSSIENVQINSNVSVKPKVLNQPIKKKKLEEIDKETLTRRLIRKLLF